MTGIEFAGLLLLVLIAVAGLCIAWCLHDKKLERHDRRLQALEDRVSILEVPEIVNQAEQRRLLATQALLRKRNGYGGQDTEGRA